MTVFMTMATTVLLSRLLAPQDLGTYFLAFNVVVLGASIATLGLNQTVVRFVAESMGSNQPWRAQRVVNLVFRLGLLGILCVATVYLLLGDFLGTSIFHTPSLAAVTGLVAAWIGITALEQLLAETFRGFHDIRLATLFGGAAIGGLLTGVLLVTGLSVLWWIGGATLTTVLLLASISGLISVLLAGWKLHHKVVALPSQLEKNLDNESRIRVSEILQVAWPLLIVSLTTYVLTQADISILGAFRSREEIAIYGAAARIVRVVAMPLMIMNAVVPPLIAEMHVQSEKKELERLLQAAATLAGLPAFLVLAGFILFGERILGVVYGNFYREGAVVLSLLSVGQLANVWAGSCGLVLIMTGHQTTMMKITIFSGLLLCGGGIWVAQNYGMIGVASVVAAVVILQNVLMLLLVKKKVGIWTYASFSLRSIRRVFTRQRT
jgi:O-antigen/teichoic acid export membrane protein